MFSVNSFFLLQRLKIIKKLHINKKNAKEIFKILTNVNKLGADFYKMTKYLHVLTHDISVFCSWKHCVSQSDAMLAKVWMYNQF